MKKTIVMALALSTLLCGFAQAANRYIRPGATGSNNGTDWTNAYSSFPGTMTRGDTYYIADGSYGSVTISTAVSGSTWIFIKKASLTDHGTNTGWNDTYGDDAANFTFISIGTNYISIDGSYGQRASDMTGYVSYGIRLVYTYQSLSDTNVNLLNTQFATHNYLTFKHMEIAFTNTPFVSGHWNRNWNCILGYGTHWTLDYMWLHHAGNTPLDNKAGDYMTITNSVIEKNGLAQLAENWATWEHSELVTLQGSNVLVKNNVFRDWASTGGLMIWEPGGNKNWLITGNVWTQTGYFQGLTNSNGMVSGLSRSSVYGDNVNLINNTFTNINVNAGVFYGGPFTNTTIRNNIFDNVSGGFGFFGESPSGTNTHDYNFYYNTSSPTEIHKQTGTSSPLVAPRTGDFRLKYATQAGDSSVGSLYNTDPPGNVRGSDGTWDRGAFEFSNAPSRTPNPPSIIRVE